MTQNSKLLTEREAADALRLSVRTLQCWRVNGDGPRFLKVGAAVRYDSATLEAWLATRSAASTSAIAVAAQAAAVR